MNAHFAARFEQPVPRTLMFSPHLRVTAGSAVPVAGEFRGVRTETLTYRAQEVTATLREIPGYNATGGQAVD